ncbi:hypothetical protein AB6806_23765 [Bosea sp. RCC_152_1]|uniref:hypothetical protein n=1 Tax=Bosea sp. RCC_152_1 TaxID=3239228 RepID=UPI003525BD54
MQPLWFVTYNTESGDSGVAGYFTEEPSDGHLTTYFKALMPDEFFTEDWGGKEVESRLVFWKVHKLEEEVLPAWSEPVPSI